MNILFLHGLDSRVFQDRVDILSRYGTVEMPFIDYRNEPNVFERIDKLVTTFKPDVIIGHSMGGVLAYYLSNKHKIQALLFMPAMSSKNKHFIKLPEDIEVYPKYKKQLVIIATNDKIIDNSITKSMFPASDIKEEPIEHNLPPYILEKWFKRFMGINEMITSINEFADNIFKIGSIDKNISVSIDVVHTKHSLDRSRRDEDQKDVVTDAEILDAVKMAAHDILEALEDGKIKIGGKVLITKTFNFLNLVCGINIKNNGLLLNVVTVMRKKNFLNKNNTYQIVI